ncbi:MAG TPA: DNA-formamidopyrimidine glycosylase family protein [Dehalococcoidia bacterium]|nr:DNA-formamidopyrimidine glycosylase family protein [Dehalococcoidia bacterium]
MPEAPDLEAYAAYIRRRLVGQEVTEARALIPVVVKVGRELLPSLAGRSLTDASRLGKQLRLDFADGPLLLLHPMISGRLLHLPHEAPFRPRTALVLAFADGTDLRLWDDRLLSRVHVYPDGTALSAPAAPVPDALDPSLTPEGLWQRLQALRGKLKALITGEKLVSGIGNAYADEVLFAAGLSPFRPAQDVTPQEAQRLLEAMRRVLQEATATVLGRMEREGLPEEEFRDHLQVHRRGGQPCPRCGETIAEVLTGGRITSYCPRCQR